MMDARAYDPTFAKTCLPQKAIVPLFKGGFFTWHIFVFLVGLVPGNIALVYLGVVPRPTPGLLTIEQLFNPATNPLFKLFLLTSVALFAKTHAMAWAQVWYGCKNNSFSKNPWDLGDGDNSKPAIKTEQDLVKSTYHNIHGNDIENIPLTLFLHLMLVLVQPTFVVGQAILLTYTITRYIHTLWYAWYGSHEIRTLQRGSTPQPRSACVANGAPTFCVRAPCCCPGATLWSINCFCDYAVCCQMVAACGWL
jgi:hypothetical protein